MANAFDQFDTPAAESSNPFDQFDAPTPAKSNPLRRLVADPAISALKSAIAVPEIAVGAADLLTGGRAGKAAEGIGFRPKEAKNFLNELYSPEQRAANEAVQKAEGFGGTLSAVAQNPSVIPHTVIESLAPMGAGGVVARAIPFGGAVLRGAMGEGAVGSGLAAETMRQESDTGLITPKQSGLAAASGLGTMAFGAAGGKLANRLGIGDVETMLAGGAQKIGTKGVVRSAAEGALSEGAFEELPQSVWEQGVQNVAMDRPIGEGVGSAAAMGLLTGGVMGAGGGGFGSIYAKTKREQAAQAEMPAEIAGLLPAPTSTGTPSDQVLQADVARQNAVDAAQKNADTIYAERAAYEQAMAELFPYGQPEVTQDVVPLQQRIDEMLGIDTTKMNRIARAKYERDLAAAFNEPVGITHDENGFEIPLTMGALLDSQVTAEQQAKTAGQVQMANQSAEARNQQVADEEVSPAIPIVGPLSAAANQAVQSGVTAKLQLQRAAEQVAQQPGAKNDTIPADQANAEVVAPSAQARSDQLPGSIGVLAPAPVGNAEPVSGSTEVVASGARPAVSAGTAGATGLIESAPSVPSEITRSTTVTTPTPAATQPGESNVSQAAQAFEATPQGPEQQPADDVAVRAYPKGQARMLAGRMTRQGLPSETYPHPIQAGMFAIRPQGEKNAEPRTQPAPSATEAPAAQRTADVAAETQAAQPADLPRVDTALAPAASFEQAQPNTIDQAANEAATSPQNDTPEPSQAQKNAGNYKVGKVSVAGLNISIENPEGSTRSGTDANGKPWSITMRSHYGYIRQTEGNDGDHVDVFVKHGTAEDYAGPVFVIDQRKGNGQFDEHKVMLGWPTVDAASAAYLENYAKVWKGLGAITPMDMPAFKQWLATEDQTQPVVPKTLPERIAATKQKKADENAERAAKFSEVRAKRKAANAPAVAYKDGQILQEDSLLPFYRQEVKGKTNGSVVPNPRFVVGEVSQDAANEIAKYISGYDGKQRRLRVSGRSIKHIEESRPAIAEEIVGNLKGFFTAPDEVLPDHKAIGKRALLVHNTATVPEKKFTVATVEIEIEVEISDGFIDIVSVMTSPERSLKAARKLKENWPEGQHLTEQAANSPHPIAAGAAHAEADLPNVRPVESSVSPVKEENKPVAIDDFGEKLGGAKKDKARSVKESLAREFSDDELVSQPLSVVWPKPDIDAIENTFVAAFAYAARDEIPVKPRNGNKLQRWMSSVKGLRNLVSRVISLPEDRVRTVANRDHLLAQLFMPKVDLLAQIDRGLWGRVGKVSEYPDSYRYDKEGKQIKTPHVAIEIDGKNQIISGKSVSDVLDQVTSLLGSDVQAKKMQFEVRGLGDSFSINKKGDTEYRKLKTFASTKEAFDFIKSNYDDLTAEWEKVKARDNVKETDVRGDENRPRTGQDWRQGKDVTPEEFSSRFGFRGVEFGNWVSQGKNAKERQGMINQAYDALMDLANIVDVPPKAISLNGSLGLGFGSRGSGAASAHFEPGNLVINLTKTRGAGTLAHEWFHALDNYFSRQRGGESKFIGDNNEYRQNNYITYKPEPLFVHKTQRSTPTSKARLEQLRASNPNSGYFKAENWVIDPNHPQGVRPEVEAAFADLVKALDDSPMSKRSKLIDKATEGYWSRIIERGARSFENYVISKMMENGYNNDYLANVRDVSDFPRAKERYPYLLPEEVKPIADAFDNLFSTMETRETENGMELFNQSNDGRITPADKAIYGMTAEGKSTTEILKFIASTSRTPFNRQLARLLQQTGLATSITLGDPREWTFTTGDGKYAAAYNPKTDTAALFRPASAERNVLHELMHAATLKALGKKGLAAAQMNGLFKHVKASGKLNGQYGMSNVDEFVAEAFTNPKFQQELKKVSAPAGSPGLKSAWHWFIRIVRGILRIPQGQENALSQALEIGVELMRENMKISESSAGPVRYTEIGKQLLDVADIARRPGNENVTVDIGQVQPWEVAAAKQSGYDLDGYRHTADMYAVRHTIERHGSAEKESARGQLPITDSDIMALPLVIMEPDSVIIGVKNHRGQEQLFSVKSMPDGTLLVAEEVRVGKKVLALVSARKIPGAKNAKELLPSVLLNVRADAGVKAILVDSPSAVNGIRYNIADDGAWSVSAPSKMDDVIYSLQDKHIDTKRVIESIRSTGQKILDRFNPYLQEELFHGRAAKGVKDFLDLELRPLLAQMRSVGVDMGDFEEYLWNRHAEERNQQIAKINPEMKDGGSGIKTTDAQAYLNNLPTDRRATFEKLAARINTMNRNSQAILVSSGLEKQETIDAWNGAYQHYVPLQREDVDTGHVGTGKGFSIRGSSTKRAVGSGRKVIDIIANITMQRERNIVRAEKNRVSNALFGLALEQPNPDFWKVDEPPKERVVTEKSIYTVLDADGKKLDEFTRMDDAEKFAGKNEGSTIEQTRGDRVEERVTPGFSTRDNVVMTRINGEDHYVIFNERDERALRMATSLKNMDADQMGRVLSLVGKATRYLASVNTQYNPVFGVINLIRDTQGALLNLTSTPLAGEQKKVMGYTVDALRGIYADIRAHRAGRAPSSKWAELFEEFQKEGGQTGYRDQYANAAERGEAIRDELKQFSEGAPKKMLRGVFAWLSDYNETMENAVRLASYKAAVEKGMSKQQAASLAKSITVNFNKKGQAATQIGALYAFFNASVQGTARLGQTLFDMEGGDIKTLRLSKTGKKIVAGGIMLGSMQAMLLAAAGYDDDEPPEFVRERNLILPIGDGKYLTLAMPLGFHILPGIGRIATEFALSGFKDPAKRAFDMFGMLSETFNPIGNAGFSLQTITPSVVDPFAALAENKDFSGREIARENMNVLNPKPGHLRAKDTATYWSKMASSAINFITGGSEFQPGMLSPTPDQLDYLIGQATGGVGREVSKLWQTGAASMSGEDLPIYKIPLAGRFVGDISGQSGESAKFYSAIKRINGHESEVKGLRQQQRAAEAAEYVAENPEARFIMLANHTERTVQKLRSQKRELLKAGAEAERIRQIDTLITQRMTQFNERVASMQR